VGLLDGQLLVVEEAAIVEVYPGAGVSIL